MIHSIYIDTKICTKCLLSLDLYQFSKAVTNLDGLRNWCRSCCKQYKKIHYQDLANKVTRREGCKKWKKANPEKVRASWKRSDPTKRREAARRWRETNRELARERKNRSVKKNPGLYNYICALRHAKKLQATPKWLTKEDFIKIKAIYQECARLNKIHGARSYHVDHIHPLRGESISGLHCPLNLQILTAEENHKKGNKFLDNRKEMY